MRAWLPKTIGVAVALLTTQMSGCGSVPPPRPARDASSQSSNHSVPTCTAGDVSATLNPERIGATGHGFTRLDFENISSSTCLLRGYPRSVKLIAAGRDPVVAAKGSWFPFPSTDPIVPGQTVTLGIDTTSTCAERPGGGPTANVTGRIETRIRGGVVTSTGERVTLDVGCGLRYGHFAPSELDGSVDPPMAETPEQAVTFYLDAVKRGDCVLAELYTRYEFHDHGDLCEGPSLGGLAFDAWRFHSALPTRTLAPRVYGYAVELHITKHGCAGSICSNGWHTWFLQVRGEQPGTGYLLEGGGTGP